MQTLWSIYYIIVSTMRHLGQKCPDVHCALDFSQSLAYLLGPVLRQKLWVISSMISHPHFEQLEKRRFVIEILRPWILRSPYIITLHITLRKNL